ncbi:MAG: transcriptional regulator [Dehalococcoidia bacterium]|nr:transcriptional regulator [Dehalococcoidia bacterium]
MPRTLQLLPAPEAPVTHPTSRLQDDVHQRVRLGILAILNGASRADFAFLRQTLGLTDGNLGKHLQVLEEAGYVAIDKVFENRRPRTWVKITRSGRAALDEELAALREVIASAERGATNESLSAG